VKKFPQKGNRVIKGPPKDSLRGGGRGRGLPIRSQKKIRLQEKEKPKLKKLGEVEGRGEKKFPIKKRNVQYK